MRRGAETILERGRLTWKRECWVGFGEGVGQAKTEERGLGDGGESDPSVVMHRGDSPIFFDDL